MREVTYEDGEVVHVEEHDAPIDAPREPTLDDRLAAIEAAITKSPDFAAMKTELAKSDESAAPLVGDGEER